MDHKNDMLDVGIRCSKSLIGGDYCRFFELVRGVAQCLFELIAAMNRFVQVNDILVTGVRDV